MHKKVEELMFADLLRFSEDGRIDLFGNNAFLLPADYVLKIEAGMKPEEIYALSKKIPENVISILRGRGMKDLERLDFMLELAEVLGMGSVQVPGFDQAKSEHEVIVKNPGQPKVSCNHTCGYLATVFSDALNKKMECREVRCVSEGAENCSFKVSPTG